eukprot:scaffold42477_cov20-Cyclotella_meneghiniana.AAC.1
MLALPRSKESLRRWKWKSGVPDIREYPWSTSMSTSSRLNANSISFFTAHVSLGNSESPPLFPGDANYMRAQLPSAALIWHLR